jgi:hypothetical protein
MVWAPVYATTANFRVYLRLPDEADTDDAIVYEPALETASRLVDKACGRQFGSVTATARYYTPRWSRTLSQYVADVDDFMSITSLAVATDTALTQTFSTAVTDFLKWPVNAAADGEPWTQLRFGPAATVLETPGSLRVTALWGWTAVPDAIVQATLLQAARIAKRRDAPFGVAGSPDMGNELRLLSKLDPDVALMVSSFRRYW